MVLDVKALTWAAQSGIDTAKLKAAKVPIYGKWYFPEIPPGVPVVNLETGEQQVFPERMLTGEVIFAPTAELARANLLPEGFSVMEPPALPGAEEPGGLVPTATRALHTLAPEPLLAMARPPGLEPPPMALVPAQNLDEPPEPPAGIHMPSASVAPFVLGVGFCIALLGIIAGPIVLIVGLIWMFAGAVGWIRIGLLEGRAEDAQHALLEAEPEHVT